MASNVNAHTTEHATTPSTVLTTTLTTATIVTSSFPHTSVIFSPKQGVKTRSSTGSNVKSTHMKVKGSPDTSATVPTKPNVSSVQDIGHFESNPITSNQSSVPNIINLNYVEDVEAWIKSGGVYVGREVDNHKLKHEGSKWGNPHTLREHKCRKKVVELFRADLLKNEERMKEISVLKGKVLGCWCSPDQCHAEVLHEFAGNSPVYEYDRDASSINVEASPLTPTSSSPNTEAVSTSSTYVQASSPTSSPSAPHSGDSLSTSPLTAFDLKSLAERLNGVEGQVIFQKDHIQRQDDRINELEERVLQLEGDLIQTKARFSVRDSVIEALRGEVHRLQQYTRRYSVTVSGIDKVRDEKDNPQVLHEKVTQLVTEVNSTTTAEDIDKFHRNGRLTNGKEQDIIIRFKSHSAKEAFYKARKNLAPSRKYVKIRPSLSNNQLNLLRDAKAVVDDLSLGEEAVNPVEFVFANIHGVIQAKLKKKFRGSPFITFNSVSELIRKTQEAQVVKVAETEFEKIQSSWADSSPRKPSSVHQSRPSDEDDMGFGLFD